MRNICNKYSNKKLMAALAVCGLAATSSAYAANFDYSGNITYQNDVVQIAFTLNTAATNVKVWTDSYQNGTNFDPVTAVWNQIGSDYSLVAQNDDNASIAPGQTSYDSGLIFSSLAAGNYMFTIGAYNNFANGTLLSQGFSMDNQTPVLLSNWCQPASHCGMGSYYSVHLTGVDSASNVSAVPEPKTYAMLLSGLGMLGFIGLRRRSPASSHFLAA